MGRIRSNYVLQVHKVTSGEVVHNFITAIWFLCHVATWTSHVTTSFFNPLPRRDVDLHVATSKLHASVTSPRGLPTSRRHFHTSQSRRDVGFHVATSILKPSVTSRRGMSRRDVIFTCLYHVVTWDSNVATWIKSTLCHVATLPPTSRRRLVKLSITSRRDPARRDVALV